MSNTGSVTLDNGVKLVFNPETGMYHETTSEFTVIFDWTLDGDEDPGGAVELVVVQAKDSASALLKAEKVMRRRGYGADSFFSVITFHGDVTGLVAKG